MDFRVYHYGARGVFDGTRPVYGLSSGLGWPMHYRYPPLFLLLFAPLAVLPIGPAAAIWVMAKIAILVWLASRDLDQRLETQRLDARLLLVPVLFITPYLIEEFRYGNAQFFVLALTIAIYSCFASARRSRPSAWRSRSASRCGLLSFCRTSPFAASGRLSDSRSLRSGFLRCCLRSILVSSEISNLLAQWFTQESHTQLGESEVWFPSQSLRGVMMRYLTLVDYSQVPDSNYALVNVVAIDPATVRSLWMILAGGIYAGFLLSNTVGGTMMPGSIMRWRFVWSLCSNRLLKSTRCRFCCGRQSPQRPMQRPSLRILICVAAALTLDSTAGARRRGTTSSSSARHGFLGDASAYRGCGCGVSQISKLCNSNVIQDR